MTSEACSHEFEAEIGAHPLVAEATAIGLPAAEGDQDVMVFVTLREGAELTGEELVEFLSPRLGRYAVPRLVEFVPRRGCCADADIRDTGLHGPRCGASTWDREAPGMFLRAKRVGLRPGNGEEA